jgi:hypothetical protein
VILPTLDSYQLGKVGVRAHRRAEDTKEQDIGLNSSGSCLGKVLEVNLIEAEPSTDLALQKAI